VNYQKDEVEPARDAFEHYVSRHSVGLIFSEDGRSPENASGIAINWQGRRLIVTASHVFLQPSNRVASFTALLPRDRPLNRGRDIVLPPKDLDCVVPMSEIPIIRSNSDDLAYFVVNEAFGKLSDIDFHELNPRAISPSPGTGCLLSGFPQDMSGQISPNEALINLANRWSEIEALGVEDRFLGGFDREREFLMKFHVADKGKRPEGFSGGGVWFPLRQTSQGIWHPVVGLAGIQSKWFERRALTTSVKVERLVRFLSESAA
jgi:hypothetical protein